MSQLQKLLDEKWPIFETDKDDPFWKKLALREAFTEGYKRGASDQAKELEELLHMAWKQGRRFGAGDSDKNFNDFMFTLTNI